MLRERAPRRDASTSWRLPEIQAFIDDLIDTMRHANGAGLAANQVGVPVRIAVIEVGDNPRYPYKPRDPADRRRQPGASSRSTTSWSRSTRAACRCPTCAARCMRHVNVRVRYLDREGVAHDEVKRGLTAGTFQHECDHLDGVLFLDRVHRPAHASRHGSSSSGYHRAAFVERINEFVARVGS